MDEATYSSPQSFHLPLPPSPFSHALGFSSLPLFPPPQKGWGYAFRWDILEPQSLTLGNEHVALKSKPPTGWKPRLRENSPLLLEKILHLRKKSPGGPLFLQFALAPGGYLLMQGPPQVAARCRCGSSFDRGCPRPRFFFFFPGETRFSARRILSRRTRRSEWDFTWGAMVWLR